MNSWLKETSRYTLGRTLLSSAQSAAFGEWGELKLAKVNKDSLKSAEDAFNSYIYDFPRGMYAALARGLLRRVYWLGDDQPQLAEAFDRALADSENDPNNVTILDLVQEADAKLLASVPSGQIKSPRFLAIVDLMRMRSDGPQAGVSKTNAPLKLAELEAQKEPFGNAHADVLHVFEMRYPRRLAGIPTNNIKNSVYDSGVAELDRICNAQYDCKLANIDYPLLGGKRFVQGEAEFWD